MKIVDDQTDQKIYSKTTDTQVIVAVIGQVKWYEDEEVNQQHCIYLI